MIAVRETDNRDLLEVEDYLRARIEALEKALADANYRIQTMLTHERERNDKQSFYDGAWRNK